MSVDVNDPEVLLAYVEGELSAADRAAVEAALRDEPALRSLVEGLRDDRAALRAWPTEDAPDGLSDQAVRRLERLERESLLDTAADAGAPDRRWRIGPVLVYSGLAAALALAAAVLFQTLDGNVESLTEWDVAYEVAEAEPSESVPGEPGLRGKGAEAADAIDGARGVGADRRADDAQMAAASEAGDAAAFDESAQAEELMEGAERQMAEAEYDADTPDGYVMQRAGERSAASATPAPAAEAVPSPADREQAAAGPLPAEAMESPSAARARDSSAFADSADLQKAGPLAAAPADSAAPRFDLSTLLGPLPWQLDDTEPRDRGTVTDQPIRTPLRPAAPVAPPSD